MDINIDQNLRDRIKQILGPLLVEHVPGYNGGQMKINRLCGTTNQVFKIQIENFKSVVFRFLSPIVDREIEGQIIQQLSKCGAAPKCYYTSLEYRIEECIQNAYHATPSQIISNPYILKAIIKKINDFHEVKMPEHIPRNILTESVFSEENKIKYTEAKPHFTYDVLEYQKLQNKLIQNFIPMKEWIRVNFGETPEKIKFCHNDLNNLNIFVRNLGELDKEAILIDFDYVGYNYAAYDLANFLNETCIQYGGPYPGFKVNKKLTVAQIFEAIQAYSTKYEGLQQDIGKMLIFVNYYWALWSILIKPTPSSPNFCPLKHGIARWQLVNYYKDLFKQRSLY